MMILRVDKRDIDRDFGQAFCRLQSAETRAGDHDPRSLTVAAHFASGHYPARPTLTNSSAASLRTTCVGAVSTAYGDDRSDNQHANFAHNLEHQFGAFSHRSGRQIYQISAPRYFVPARDQVSGRQLSA